VSLHGPGGVFPLSGKNMEPYKKTGLSGRVSLLSDKHKPLIEVLAAVLIGRARRTLEVEAIRTAKEVKHKDNMPSSSTLSRVALVLRREDWRGKALRELEQPKKPAKDALKKCRFKHPEESLWEVTVSNLKTPENKGKNMLKDKTIKGVRKSLNHFFDDSTLELIKQADKDAPSRLTQIYLIALYKALSRQNREH
jgi:hypothetical protein